MVDRYSGLIPLDDRTQIPDNSYFEQPRQKSYTPDQLYNPPPIDECRKPQKVTFDRPYVQPVERIVKDTEKAPPLKKKRKTSVEGDTIGELVLNIIKDKPNVNMTRKAIRKMAEMIEDEREDIEFNL